MILLYTKTGNNELGKYVFLRWLAILCSNLYYKFMTPEEKIQKIKETKNKSVKAANSAPVKKTN